MELMGKLIAWLPSNATEASAWVTAIATAVLAVFTALLAWFTWKLAEVTRQPSVIATMELNAHAMNHFDLHVQNEGTASAFDIQVRFDPTVERSGRRADRAVPLQSISVLKPGQQISSALASFADLQGRQFTVSITWKRHPRSRRSSSISYVLDMNAFAGMERLGTPPAIQVARELEAIKKQLQAFGRERLGVDVFTRRDRAEEAEVQEHWMEQAAAEFDQLRGFSARAESSDAESGAQPAADPDQG